MQAPPQRSTQPQLPGLMVEKATAVSPPPPRISSDIATCLCEHEQSGIFESKGPRRGFLNASNVMFSYTPYVVFAANDELCRHAMSNYACHPVVSLISKMHDVGKS